MELFAWSIGPSVLLQLESSLRLPGKRLVSAYTSTPPKLSMSVFTVTVNSPEYREVTLQEELQPGTAMAAGTEMALRAESPPVLGRYIAA